MAAIEITKGLDALRKIFAVISNVYFIKTPNQVPSDITTIDFELPVLEDGVNFSTGEADVTTVKLTTTRNWVSYAAKGDPDISLQVSSVIDDINELFMEYFDANTSFGGTLNGKEYLGKGYSLEPKKVTGALILVSKDKAAAIYLPNVEMFASFENDQDKTSYYSVKVTPLADASGAELYIMNEKPAATSGSGGN